MSGSDERLQASVFAALENDPDIDADRIFVDVTGMVVQLSGSVQSAHQKWCAAVTAKLVLGVRAVSNLIVVDH